ncbi:MAG: FAD-binding oxidoreductase [Nitrososphaerota archaeon]|nr:FAD-binding oxidoreductase [Candidatus Calditenuaceae archaeon]MDW8072954.1 FAD-binding oxidoreductase [Nitrososphaerota archaeon]
MTIVDIADETDLCKTYKFVSLFNQEIFPYHPGQDVKLYFDTPLKKNDFRLYSIASPPTRKSFMELTIKSEHGQFAPYFLAKAKVNDQYVIEGPYGRFLSKPLRMIKDKELDTLVFLAASSGIVPFRCFIEYAIDVKLNVDIWLFYVNRTRNDLIYRGLLPVLLENCPKLRLLLNFTREHEISIPELYETVCNVKDEIRDRVEFLFGRRLEFDDIASRVENWKEAWYGICGGARFIAGDRQLGQDGMMQKIEKGGVERSRIEIDSYGTK